MYADNTAIDFWRWRARTSSCLERPSPTRLRVVPRGSPSKSDVLAACEHFAESDSPAHVIVSGSNHCRAVDGVAFHVVSTKIPSGSFMKLCDGVYVATPEYVLVRMASRLDRFEMLRLLYEFCGAYVRNEGDARGFSNCEPITSLGRVSRFVEKASGIRGVREARLLTRHVLGGSASPRETDVAMQVTLPQHMGGYGLGGAKLNERIELTESQRRELSRPAITPDMVWVGNRLALEYESDAWHSGSKEFVRDSRRRNDLRTLGYDVITVTNDEFKSVSDMDRIAKNLAKGLGVRMRVSVADYEMRKLMLRTRIADNLRNGGATKAGLRIV